MSAELARRLVACKHWRWMDGMTDIDGCRVALIDGKLRWLNPFGDGAGAAHSNLSPAERHPGCEPSAGVRGDLPDLDDPATLGCLLALVREAWGDAFAYCEHHSSGWSVYGVFCSEPAQSEFGAGNTEAEALVAALEAAP